MNFLRHDAAGPRLGAPASEVRVHFHPEDDAWTYSPSEVEQIWLRTAACVAVSLDPDTGLFFFWSRRGKALIALDGTRVERCLPGQAPEASSQELNQ